VLDDVGQGLLRDAQQVLLDGLGQPPPLARRDEVGGDGTAGQDLGAGDAERLGEVKLLQLDTADRLFARKPGRRRPAAGTGAPLPRAEPAGAAPLDLGTCARASWRQFDLTQALSIASAQILTGSPIAADLVTAGERRRLPETVEENLLRIAQETLTNVVQALGGDGRGHPAHL